MNNILYEFIESMINIAQKSFDEMDTRTLCDFLHYAPYYCNGGYDCEEGIYKYLTEEV